EGRKKDVSVAPPGLDWETTAACPGLAPGAIF
ncbi:unnamed protein product, partial [marine sediment metagenome]